MLHPLASWWLWSAGCAGPSPGGTEDSSHSNETAATEPTPLVTPGTLVSIPGGSFSMGCDRAAHPQCDGDEGPVHNVILSPYAMEATEVSFAQWRACIDAFACPELTGGLGPDNHPATGMREDGAEQYCAWAGGRLPTEAEWERAARGVDGGLYPWGDAEPDCERTASRACDGGTRPVATHPAGVTPEGVYDLAGNAWEWVTDIYDATYYSRGDGAENPQGAPGYGLRIVRGIETLSDPLAQRSTNREVAIPDGLSVVVGFRCVREEP